MKKSIFLFFAAILCATSAWAGKCTIYVTPANMWGSSWDYSNSSLKIAYNYNSSSGDQWTGEKAMTKTTYTFHNFPVYSYEISSSTNWAKIFVYHYKNNTKKDTYNVGGDNWIEFTKYATKLYNGWRNNAHEWLEQSEFDKNTQVTVYYALDNTSEHTIKANMRISNDYDVWKTYTMNSTGKTYNGKTIYSCTFTDYREYLYVLQFQQYDGSNWKSQVVPIDNKWTAKSTYENKLYTGSEWIDYTYDVTATFNANGHGTAPNSQTVLNGNKINEPTAPSEDGYTFGGWYKEEACTTKWNFNTDVVNENITLYAKWTEITHTVTFANDGNGTTNKTGEIEVGVVTGIEINAEPNTDYEFKVWESSNGGTFATTADVANNTFYPTANTTLTATFRSTAVNALLVVAGENITSVTGSAEPVTLGSSYPISATFPAGYKFTTWTAEPAANATFADAESATTDVTVHNGSVTVTASATEIMSTLTTSNKYDAGDPGYAVPYATVSKIGIATTATVTATTAGNGYTFTGWTLTNCTRTDGGATDATSITVRSNGDGEAATATANYTEVLTTGWTLKGSFVDDFATAYDFTKKSGESTGKVAYVSIDLDAHKEYQFKVVENGSTWYGNNNSDEEWWIKQTAEDWSFYSDAGNCHMKTGLAGTYTFKIDYSGANPKVSVYFPEIYAIVGSFNEWNENTNKLTFDGNIGTATINLEASATNYEFKVIDNAVHGGIVNKTITQTENDLAITVGGGDNIKLTANANPKGNYIFTYDKSTKKLSVTYPTVYTITVEAENGTVEGAGTYVEGTSIILTATAADGYTFTGWSNGETENPYTIEVTEDITLTANFELKSYTITATAENGTVEGAGTYDHGANVTLTAEANEGYKFVNWTKGGEIVSTDATYTFTATEDADLVANFKATTITLTTGNNDAVIAANIGNTVDVVIERSFTANDGYYTLCVPFNMPASVIGKAYSLGTITEHVAGEGININLKEENELSAGMPYLVLPKENMDKLVVENVTILPDGAEGQGVEGSQELNVQIFFQGYYSASGQTNGSTEYYVGNEGYLYNGVVDIRGLCGLFTITDKNGDPLKVRARVVTREDAATGFENITNGENTTIKLIENGQLIIIRNGEKFNAQGQKL